MDFDNFYISGNGNEYTQEVRYLPIYFTWRKYDVSVTFMTLMSCDNVSCMCDKAWSSRWIDDAID